MSKLPPLPEGALLDTPSHINAPPPTVPPTPTPTPARDDDHNDDTANDAPVHPPYCLRSVYSNHIADLLNGLPPARYGVGRDYLETDPDNPIPWAITDAAYFRFAQTDAPQIDRKALLARHNPVLRPRSPPHRNDFPRPAPDGDPRATAALKASPYPPRDAATRWTTAQRSAFLVDAMIRQFPPNTTGVVATRRWTTDRQQPSAEALTGLQPELDAMVDAKALQARRYEAFHVEWVEMQALLRARGEELRAEYARVYEDLCRVHHLFVRHRIDFDEYKPVREALIQQLDGIFQTVGMVANTTGALYAVGRAVAQGVLPPGGVVGVKLDTVCICWMRC